MYMYIKRNRECNEVMNCVMVFSVTTLQSFCSFLPSLLPTPMIRYFNEFLMAHSRETAEQVRSEYVDTMGKMYYSYFKDYHSKLMKLQVCTSA